MEERSLKSLLDAGEPIGLERAATITRQILVELSQLHGTGLIHRNLHAGCVFVGANDRVRLGGLDLVRLREPVPAPQSKEAGGEMSGKVAALSPEQVTGGPVDERTDLFPVGMILYRLLAGRPPFGGDSAWQRAKQIAQQDPRGLSSWQPSLPRTLDDVTRIALAKDPAQRFRSAREFEFYLRMALEQRSHAIAVRHIFTCTASSGVEQLRDTLERQGGEIIKTVGDEIIGCFTASASVVPAMLACRTHQPKAALHHGALQISDGDIMGDNVAVAFQLCAKTPGRGIFFSARAVEALPPQDKERLRLSAPVLEPLMEKAYLAQLIGSPRVYEL